MGARPASAGAPGRRVSRAQSAARRAPGRRAEKGAPARGERVAKYNRVLEIAQRR